jgi:hypothetical protein
MKVLGKIWSGIKWAAGKVWSGVKWLGAKAWAGMKWAGGKVWGAAKKAYGFVKKQPTWKIALVGLAGVAAVVIASKLAKGGGSDMDLYGQNSGGGSGIATAAKVVGGAVAIGAGAELGYRAYKGVSGKIKSKSSGSSNPGSTPTPVTDVTLPGATTGAGSGKAPTSPATYQIGGEQDSTQGQDIEPVSDLDLNISDAEIQELEGELDAFDQGQESPAGLGFSAAMSKVGAQ